jgi:hypothetical protein
LTALRLLLAATDAAFLTAALESLFDPRHVDVDDVHALGLHQEWAKVAALVEESRGEHPPSTTALFWMALVPREPALTAAVRLPLLAATVSDHTSESAQALDALVRVMSTSAGRELPGVLLRVVMLDGIDVPMDGPARDTAVRA